MNSPYSEAQRREFAVAVARSLQAQLDDLRGVAAEVEEATGYRILNARPAILSASRRDIDNLTLRAQAWLAAAAVIDQWMLPTDARDLGSVAKVMPAAALKDLRRALRLAGLLADDGPLP